MSEKKDEFSKVMTYDQTANTLATEIATSRHVNHQKLMDLSTQILRNADSLAAKASDTMPKKKIFA